MKFIVIISHVISHDLNQICEPFENFDNFQVINRFLYSLDHKYVLNLHFHKQSFAMECDKHFEVGLFLD
jgi:hypothetical protein